jgi:hypothetical protein
MGEGKSISRQRPVYEFGQMTGKPLEHYAGVFASLDPAEIAARTHVPYDAARRRFTLTLMGERHEVGWPGAAVDSAGPYARILMLRYLDEGRYVGPTGRYIAYNELPWGDVYNTNFQGRVISRFLREFGGDLDTFRLIMEETPAIGAVREEKCDIGYRFDFMDGIPMKLLVWEGDDEFPPAAQILYDESVVFGYTAEDIAVAGDILIAHLKKLRAGLVGQGP